MLSQEVSRSEAPEMSELSTDDRIDRRSQTGIDVRVDGPHDDVDQFVPRSRGVDIGESGPHLVETRGAMLAILRDDGARVDRKSVV